MVMDIAFVSGSLNLIRASLTNVSLFNLFRFFALLRISLSFLVDSLFFFNSPLLVIVVNVSTRNCCRRALVRNMLIWKVGVLSKNFAVKNIEIKQPVKKIILSSLTLVPVIWLMG